MRDGFNCSSSVVANGWQSGIRICQWVAFVFLRRKPGEGGVHRRAVDDVAIGGAFGKVFPEMGVFGAAILHVKNGVGFKRETVSEEAARVVIIEGVEGFVAAADAADVDDGGFDVVGGKGGSDGGEEAGFDVAVGWGEFAEFHGKGDGNGEDDGADGDGARTAAGKTDAGESPGGGDDEKGEAGEEVASAPIYFLIPIECEEEEEGGGEAGEPSDLPAVGAAGGGNDPGQQEDGQEAERPAGCFVVGGLEAAEGVAEGFGGGVFPERVPAGAVADDAEAECSPVAEAGFMAWGLPVAGDLLLVGTETEKGGPGEEGGDGEGKQGAEGVAPADDNGDSKKKAEQAGGERAGQEGEMERATGKDRKADGCGKAL